MKIDGRKRAVIECVKPSIDDGRFAIKRIEGESVTVWADCFADGHDLVSARVLYRSASEQSWNYAPMQHRGNDRFRGFFTVERIGSYLYTVEAWVDHFLCWREALEKKYNASSERENDYLIGIKYLESALLRIDNLDDREKLHSLLSQISDTSDRRERIELALGETLKALMKKYPDTRLSTTFSPQHSVTVESKSALFSSWYEFFPRSCASQQQSHGTLMGCAELLPSIAKMGFDIIYFPPVHPIGEMSRKGRNNSVTAEENDPGSPWAIGSELGGHKALHPQLGSREDFRFFIDRALSLGLQVAIDIAFQCAPDHPYVKEHPEWFSVLPDGTIQHAENPPKKYEDIVPFNFESPQWQSLWNELRDVVLFWIGEGVRIFRVDNPHTKPFPFWQWLIGEIRMLHPEVIFLSEAFTRPKIMYRLAKLGFSQSYTYFTWRNTKKELTGYMEELTRSEVSEFFRPNFWPNTPDILPQGLQIGGENAFAMRLVLAATLSSNYGIYGPAYEQAVRDALPGKEEYADSEKYRIYSWNYDAGEKIRGLAEKVNRIRKENRALQSTSNIHFFRIDNDYMMFYGKYTSDMSNIILVVINLDPYHYQSGKLFVPLQELGIGESESYLFEDLLMGEKFLWYGQENLIGLDPAKTPAFIFRVKRELSKESDFEYY